MSARVEARRLSGSDLGRTVEFTSQYEGFEPLLAGGVLTGVEHHADRVYIHFNSPELPDGTTVRLSPCHSDATGYGNQLSDAFGTRSEQFVNAQLHDLITRATNNDGSIDGVRVNSMLATIDGIRPRNELETTLAVQIALTHDLSARLMQRAAPTQGLDAFNANVNAATKLQRTLVLQIEALANAASEAVINLPFPSGREERRIYDRVYALVTKVADETTAAVIYGNEILAELAAHLQRRQPEA